MSIVIRKGEILNRHLCPGQSWGVSSLSAAHVEIGVAALKNDATFSVSSQGQSNLLSFSGSDLIFSVTPGGCVGIGKVPAAGVLLDVNGCVCATTVCGADAWTDCSTYVYYSAGSVGIGTASTPGDTLDVYGGGIRITNIHAAAGALEDLSFVGCDDGGVAQVYACIAGCATAVGAGVECGVQIFSTVAAGSVAERMRLTALGCVGIGTTSPSAKLDVQGGVRLGADNANNVLNTSAGSAPSGALYWGDLPLTRCDCMVAYAICCIVAGTGLSGGGSGATVNLEIDSPADTENIFKTICVVGVGTVVASGNCNPLCFVPACGTTIALDNTTNLVTFTLGLCSGNMPTYAVCCVIASTGLSGGGGVGALTLTNTSLGSSQNIFKTICSISGASYAAACNTGIFYFALGCNTTLGINDVSKCICIGLSVSPITCYTNVCTCIVSSVLCGAFAGAAGALMSANLPYTTCATWCQYTGVPLCLWGNCPKIVFANGTADTVRNCHNGCVLIYDGCGSLRTIFGCGNYTCIVGNLCASCCVTKVSGSFVINHPCCSKECPNVFNSKELVHFFSESPRYGVFYEGSGMLCDGEAEVVLPEYFECLTDKKQDYYVILSNAGEWAPLFTEGVCGKQFVVKTTVLGKQNATFYWRVAAARGDQIVREITGDKVPEIEIWNKYEDIGDPETTLACLTIEELLDWVKHSPSVNRYLMGELASLSKQEILSKIKEIEDPYEHQQE